MTAGRWMSVLLVSALLAPAVARAQTDPRLVAALRQAQEGHSDSARAVVGQLLQATPTTDSLYPEILYTQAMVASDAGEMRTGLQRIAVEYSTSAWADDALLRLVQMDYATHNLSGAARNLEKLRSDYPASNLISAASYWGGRVYFELNNPALGCRWLADGLAQSQGDIEQQNRLNYLNQRCANVPATASDSTGAPHDSTKMAAADSTRPPSGSDSTTTSAGPAGKTVYRIQVAAVGNKAAANDAERKARALGLTVKTVHDKKLYKVRVGQYATRAEAQAAAAGLKVKLGGTPFVVSEP
jgi:septal ring-binding cell division protein DamX